MVILRIRQAETALADGRLDEAGQLLADEQVRSHRRGQELIGRLARAFVARGQEHLAAGRPAQAGTDCEKAAQLAGNISEVAALKAAVADAVVAGQREQRHRADLARAAREQIRNGRLSAGEGLLADLPSSAAERRSLLREAAGRHSAAQAALGQARRAVQRKDWTAAIEALIEARRQHSSNPQTEELVAVVTSEAIGQVRSAIQEGRIDLAETLLRRLVPLAGEHLEVRELRGLVEQCGRAAEAVAARRMHRARETLRRLRPLLPEADWIGQALAAAEQAAEGIEVLRGGPLGLSAPASANDEVHRPGAIPMVRPARPETPDTRPGTANGRPARTKPEPHRFLIQVDGVGSFLVLRPGQVRIGPACSSRPAELRLVAQADLPETEIRRWEEDYFLSAVQPVRVNEKRTTSRLLADGDKIALSPRCRLRFALPNPASTTAVLHLSGSRVPNPDVRRVLLLDREIILGPGPSAHIRADALTEPIVLQWRGDGLICRSKGAVSVDGRTVDSDEVIRFGSHVRVGPVSFVVTGSG